MVHLLSFTPQKKLIKNKSSFAIWDSHCGHFRMKGKEILEIETFTNKINDDKKFLAKNVLVSTGDKLHQFKIPINADPLKLTNKELFFETKEDFKFYIYAAKNNGLYPSCRGDQRKFVFLHQVSKKLTFTLFKSKK